MLIKYIKGIYKIYKAFDLKPFKRMINIALRLLRLPPATIHNIPSK